MDRYVTAHSQCSRFLGFGAAFRGLLENLFTVESQIATLALREAADICIPNSRDTHLLEGRDVCHWGDKQSPIVTERNETVVEQMVDVRR